MAKAAQTKVLSVCLRQSLAVESMLFKSEVSAALLSSPPMHSFLVSSCVQGNSLGLWLCVILWGFCPLLCLLGPGISDFSLHSWNTVYESPRLKDQQYCGMDLGMSNKSWTGWHLAFFRTVSIFVSLSIWKTVKETWNREVLYMLLNYLFKNVLLCTLNKFCFTAGWIFCTLTIRQSQCKMQSTVGREKGLFNFWKHPITWKCLCQAIVCHLLVI